VGHDEMRLKDSGRVVGSEGRHEKIMMSGCRCELHECQTYE
jgi:hypothetical protein